MHKKKELNLIPLIVFQKKKKDVSEMIFFEDEAKTTLLN